MDEAIDGGATARPLWRRIVEFPLVAMLAAVAIFALAYVGGILIGKPLPPMDKTMGDLA